MFTSKNVSLAVRLDTTVSVTLEHIRIYFCHYYIKIEHTCLEQT